MKTKRPEKKTAIPRGKWIWYGSPGHFILSHRCVFHLLTEIGKYMVSTVGDMWEEEEMKDVWPGAKYETMVFKISERCPCGCGTPRHNGREIQTFRSNTAKDATEAHYNLCEKVSRGKVK